MVFIETAAKLLALRQLKFEGGRIEILHHYGFMAPIEFIVDLQKELERQGQKDLLYISAKNSIKTWFRDMHEKHKFTKEDVFKWGMSMGAISGWGETEILKTDTTNKILETVLKNSAQAYAYGKSDHPVDDFMRGAYAAAASILFETDCDTIETSCIAEGARECRFICKAI